jgi:hypothetical protein
MKSEWKWLPLTLGVVFHGALLLSGLSAEATDRDTIKLRGILTSANHTVAILETAAKQRGLSYFILKITRTEPSSGKAPARLKPRLR